MSDGDIIDGDDALDGTVLLVEPRGSRGLGLPEILKRNALVADTTDATTIAYYDGIANAAGADAGAEAGAAAAGPAATAIATTVAAQITNALLAKGPIRPNSGDYGPCGNGIADQDTAAWKLAIAASVEQGRPIEASGTYFFKPGPTPLAANSGIINNEVFTALPLVSGLKIYGRNLTMVPVEPDFALIASQRLGIFGTGLQNPRHTLTGVDIEEVTFHHLSSVWSSTIFANQYCIVGSGIDALHIDNVRHLFDGDSSAQGIAQSRRGRFAMIHNSDDLRQTRMRWEGTTQGGYYMYLYGAKFDDLTFSGLSEGIDFDGPCWDIQVNKTRARDFVSNDAQLFDTGGGTDFQFTDIVASGLLNIIGVYCKHNAYPSLPMLIANVASHGGAYFDPVPADQNQIPQRYSIRGVRGRNLFARDASGNILENGNAIFVGNYRDDDYDQGAVAPPTDISFQDVELVDSRPVTFNEGRRGSIDGMKLTRTRAPEDGDTGGALVLQQSRNITGYNKTSSEISGRFRNIYVEDAQRCAVIASGGHEQELEHVKVNGYNTSGSPVTNTGIRVARLGFKGGTTKLGSWEISGPGQPFSVAGGGIAGEGPDPYKVVQTGPITAAAGYAVEPTVAGGTLRKRITKQHSIVVPSASSMGGQTLYYRRLLACPVGRKMVVSFATATTSEAFAGNANNYTELALIRCRAGVRLSLSSSTCTYDAVNRAPGEIVPFGVADYSANMVLVAGDTLELRSTQIGVGSVLPDFILNISITDWED